MSDSPEIRRAILELRDKRGKGKTFCPSEAAREVDPHDWKPLMEPVREEARKLYNEGQLDWYQGEELVSPKQASGPVRLGEPSGGI